MPLRWIYSKNNRLTDSELFLYVGSSASPDGVSLSGVPDGYRWATLDEALNDLTAMYDAIEGEMERVTNEQQGNQPGKEAPITRETIREIIHAELRDFEHGLSQVLLAAGQATQAAGKPATCNSTSPIQVADNDDVGTMVGETLRTKRLLMECCLPEGHSGQHKSTADIGCTWANAGQPAPVICGSTAPIQVSNGGRLKRFLMQCHLEEGHSGLHEPTPDIGPLPWATEKPAPVTCGSHCSVRFTLDGSVEAKSFSRCYLKEGHSGQHEGFYDPGLLLWN